MITSNLKKVVFLFAMNQYSDRDEVRVKLLEQYYRVFTVSDSTETKYELKHFSGHFDNIRFWDRFLNHEYITGSSIILDYFWLQSGTKEKYFNTRYGGEKWLKKDGFIDKFLQAGGKEVLLPHDSGSVVSDMIKKHSNTCDFHVSVVNPSDNIFVTVSKCFSEQSKYTFKGELKYYLVRAS